MEAKPTDTGHHAATDLFDFAVDREDTKALMARLPADTAANRVAVEYELQALRIISVGWSISYYLERVLTAED